MTDIIEQVTGANPCVATADLVPQLPPPELDSWLSAAAIPVSVDPADPVDDLEPLRSALDGARVVGIGEATHGTCEFFTLKHRLVRFLVERLDFTAFAIEGFPAECLALDRYVKTGIGDPTPAVRMIYGGFPWDVEEVLALVEWVRIHNSDPTTTRKVGFYGFDVHGTAGAVLLARYLSRAGSPLAAAAEEVLAQISTSARLARFQHLSRPQRAAHLWRVDRLIEKLVDSRDRLVESTSEAEWGDARRCAEAVRQVATVPLPSDVTARVEPRERGQAMQVLNLLELEEPAGKLALWAHNAHVQKQDYYTNAPACGSYLDAALGSQYMTIGLAFNHGEFRAFNESGVRSVFPVAPAPAGSLDAAFAAHRDGNFIVDLRTCHGAVAQWLARPVPSRSIGGDFGEESQTLQWLQQAPCHSFDLIGYVRETTAATPLPAANGGTRLEATPRHPLEAPVNLDLAISTADGGPTGWCGSTGREPLAYTVRRLDEGCDYRVRIERLESTEADFIGGRAVLMQNLSAQSWRGKSVTVRTQLRAAPPAMERDAELLFVEAREEIDDSSLLAAPPLRAAVASAPSPAGGEVSVTLDVPVAADVLSFGVRLVGPGWLEAGAFTLSARI